jgi:hypothetical protein
MQVPPGSRYGRLVRGVLVAVLHPGDGFPGDRIEALRRTGLELLRTAGGDAEPLGDDGVAAVFDDPAAASRRRAGCTARRPSTRKATPGGPGAVGSDPLTRPVRANCLPFSPPSASAHVFASTAPRIAHGGEKSQRVLPPTGEVLRATYLGAGVPFTTLSYPGVGPACATPVPAKTDTPSTTAAIVPAFSLVHAIGVRGFVRYTQD